jgi:hypothetical protein
MTLPVLRRDVLMLALGGNPELVSAFEQMYEAAETLIAQMEGVTGDATAVREAGVLTLSDSPAFLSSRVFTVGDGLEMVNDGDLLTISIADLVPRIEGSHSARFVVTGDSFLVLPTVGTLATVEGPEMLSNKTLATPKLSGVADYADDTAAAAGGVPVGGVYRTASALKMRVA